MADGPIQVNVVHACISEYPQLKNNQMDNDYEIIRWNDIRNKLSEKYPRLTNADLIWRHSSIDDLFEMIAFKLGKSERELRDIVDET